MSDLVATVEGSDEFINDLQNDFGDSPGVWIEDDPVVQARTLVNAIRSSGQRREDLEKIILDGYETGKFTKEQVPNHVPLKDMDIRWSSTYLMIDRLLELYPVGA